MGGGVWGQKIKVAQNDLKHILVLEFLKSNDIFWKFDHKHLLPCILVQIILNLNDFLFWWKHFFKEKKKIIEKSLNKKIEKKFFWGPNSRQVKSSVILFSMVMVGRGGGVGVKNKSKFLRMSWNTFWFWNFWNPMKFFTLSLCRLTTNPY